MTSVYLNCVFLRSCQIQSYPGGAKDGTSTSESEVGRNSAHEYICTNKSKRVKQTRQTKSVYCMISKTNVHEIKARTIVVFSAGLLASIWRKTWSFLEHW